MSQLFSDALWLFLWGLYAAGAVILAIAVGGFATRFRWLAGLCVAALGIGSSVVILAITLGYGTATLGQLPFLIPGLVASGIGIWFVRTEHPS